MAVDEINAAGGVNGKPVVVKNADDGTSPTSPSSSLDTLLTSDKVDAIVGPASSGTAWASSTRSRPTASSTVRVRTRRPSCRSTAAPPVATTSAPRRPDNFQGPALAQVDLERQQDEGRDPRPATTRTAPASVDALGEGASTTAAPTWSSTTPYDPKSADFSADVGKVVDQGRRRGRRDRLQRRRRQGRSRR